MGKTMAEKILAAHAQKDEMSAGQLADVSVDVAFINDLAAPITIREFKKLGVNGVFDPERIIMVPDHSTPNKDIKSAQQCLEMRRFARELQLPYHIEVGRMGIEHVLLPEQGWVGPGDVVVGSDSHTCTYGALGAFATGMGSTDIAVAMATGKIWMRVPETIRVVYSGRIQPWVSGKDLVLYTIGQLGVGGARYRAIEFTGPLVKELSMDNRFTMSNMAIEAGAKAGLFEVDQKTLDYVDGRTKRPFKIYEADRDANYVSTLEIDASLIEPQVAYPHSPENSKPVRQAAAENINIDQVVIGSCTNGRLEDLQVAAQVLGGRKVHPNVRCIIFPGSQQVYLDALREGLVEQFILAGCAFSTPTCGPCLGGHMGVLAAGERAVSTTNRNFKGRMGHPDSEVYLASPAVAAASACAGRIAHPDELVD